MREGMAIIVGMGGIGRALGDAVEASGHFQRVERLSRANGFDPHDETSVARAAKALAHKECGVRLMIVTTGMLHDAVQSPEKSLRELDSTNLARSFAINAIAPAIIAKHFLPLFQRGQRGVFAALSARVGSISDNRNGGWHGYRASKAALNMLIKTIAIEQARTRPEIICVGLHPGTVDTAMSRPFQRGVLADSLFSPARAAQHLLEVIENLDAHDSGKCFAWDGSEIPA